jgi:CheY-like chemotaxis protein
MTGVPIATIRNWEERYLVLQPERSAGGQRLYSRDEVDQLKFVVREMAEGISPADAHRVLQDRLAAPGGTPALGGQPARHQLAILLAERDPYAAELTDYFLRTEGYDVIVTFDLAEAEAVVADRTPDLVAIEWLIGGGAGGRLCAEIRETSDAPILVLSPLDVRDAALEAGADAFLLKPLDPLTLVSVVQDLLGESALVRAPAPAVTA